MRPTEHTLDAGGICINYAEGAPTGPPLVLLHGIAARWQTMGLLIPALSFNWRVFAPDLRGHGKSGRAGPRYGLEDFTADIVALLSDRTDEPAAFFGHSLGGWIALTIAAERPELVRGVVVADSAISPTANVPVSAVSYLDGLPMVMRGMAQSQNQLDPGVMEALHNGELTRGWDPAALLPRVTCPVLLVQANPTLGGLMLDQDVELAMELLPQVSHVRLDELDHGCHVRNPQQVLDVIVPFLDSLARSDRPENGSGADHMN